MTFRAYRISFLSLFVSITCASSALASGPEWFEPEAPKAKPGQDAASPSSPSSPSSKPRPTESRAPRAPKAGSGESGMPAAPKASANQGAGATPEGKPTDGSPTSSTSPKSTTLPTAATSPTAPANQKAPLPAEAAAGAKAGATVAAPRHAAASRAAPKAAREATTTEWYGWQTLAADGASLGLVIAGAASDKPTLAALGILSYVVTSPTIHALKNEHGRAGVSLGFRLIGPVVGVLGGMAASDIFCGQCGVDYSPTWVVGGALVGIASGPIFDAVFQSKRAIKARPSVSLAPAVVPSRQGMTVGLTGAF